MKPSIGDLNPGLPPTLHKHLYLWSDKEFLSPITVDKKTYHFSKAQFRLRTITLERCRQKAYDLPTEKT